MNSCNAKQSKCMFACNEVEYLGHLISSEGVRTDPKKTTAIQQWPVPKNVKVLRGFLGLIGYYRKFVRGYGQIVAPLTTFLKKDSFVWTSEADIAFQRLKEAISCLPVLALLDFTKPFIVECDASGLGLGVVLMQDHRPIAYHSQALKGSKLSLSTYEKELLALVVVVKKWRPYLLGRPFVIKIDHYSLKYLLEQRVGTPAQQEWISKLLGYAFIVEYKQGRENVVTDDLSRRQCDAIAVPPSDLAQCKALVLAASGSCSSDACDVSTCTLCIISFPTPFWLSKLKSSYDSDTKLKAIFQNVQSSFNSPPGFTFCNGLLFYKGRLYLGDSNKDLKAVVLQ